MLPGSKAGGLGLAEGRGHSHSGVSRCTVGHGAWALSASDSRGLVHASEDFLEETPTGETVWVFLGNAELIEKTAPLPHFRHLFPVWCAHQLIARCPKCQEQASACLVGGRRPSLPSTITFRASCPIKGRKGWWIARVKMAPDATKALQPLCPGVCPHYSVPA